MIAEVTPARTDLVGNGTTGPYTGLFQIDANTEVEVIIGGVTKTLTVDYTVSGVGGATFSITTIATVASPTVISLIRKQPLAQASDYVAGEGNVLTRVESDLDKASKVSQMLREIIGRSLKFAKISTKKDIDLEDPVDGKYLYYDNAAGKYKHGTPTAAGALTSPVPVADGGTGSTTAAAARAALAVAGLADENSFTKTQSWAKGANIASASPLVLGTDGNFFIVTGTVSFAAISSKPNGTIICLEFNNALTMTHSATLELPGAANITTANGDRAIFVSNAAGDWHCFSYSKADGTPIVTTGTPDLTSVGDRTFTDGKGIYNSDHDSTFRSGTSTDDNTVVTRRETNTTQQATTGTAKETLATITLAANTLIGNGKAVRVRAWFTCAAGANAKGAGVDFGGTTVAAWVTTTIASLFIFCDVIITRTSLNNQRYVGHTVLAGNGSGNAGGHVGLHNGAATVTEAAAIAITFHGTSAVTGEVTFNGAIVEVLN